MPRKTIIRCAELVYDERILHIYFFEHVEIDLSDVKEIYNTGITLSGGKPYCALAHLNNSPASTPEARAFGATEAYAKFRLADALLTDSLSMKLIANSYIKFNKPVVPTKMFTTEREAIEWLKTFLA
jgi:hypothetical protein